MPFHPKKKNPSIYQRKELLNCVVGGPVWDLPYQTQFIALTYAYTYSVDLSCYMSSLSFCYIPHAPSFYGRFYDLTTHISTVPPDVQIRKITTKLQDRQGQAGCLFTRGKRVLGGLGHADTLYRGDKSRILWYMLRNQMPGKTQN